ncbi:hypothetical protein TrLO_g14027 [Triparma laevis f. longispina]|uniref:3-isopropylmalate dehydratase n=2 Tax=Triparma laevis TaxID=1534972 RepID=A0A9W6ZGE1_9STRA|nr:hypothetical protein TrLO_g14027 [Triparma laevis f. longispina]
MKFSSLFIAATGVSAFNIPPSLVQTRGSLSLNAGKTLYDKIFEDHTVTEADGSTLLYIDRHLVHEVTSPQAFEGLLLSSRSVRRPDCTLVTVDHNVPTEDRSDLKSVESFIEEINSRTQVLKLEENVKDFGLKYFGMADERQGIVHIIGPEQGFTLPGTTCVCGDSHTATHGAFGALAFGIGTSEVEHVLATSTLGQVKGMNMLIRIEGKLEPGVESKDVVLHICGVIGTAGGTGSVIEFAGEAIEGLSMEGRMSISNMAIEAGARAGLIAPDEITFEYLKGRPMSPSSGSEWDSAVTYWKSLKSDADAVYDKTVVIQAGDIAPTVTWGTSPQDVAPITGKVPDPENSKDDSRKAAMKRSLEYIGLEANQELDGVEIDKAFIGSCTNGRIEDMRAVAAIAKGRKVKEGVDALVVPGSGLVKKQAEDEGLDKILIDAGFDWREPGCSMCLAMNADKLKPQERCASTSNRNFEGRQGGGGRTHLVSPAMAAAAAVAGTLTDIRNYPYLGEDGTDPRLTDTNNRGSRVFSTEELKSPGAVVSPVAPYLKDKVGEGKVKSGLPKFEVLTGKSAPLDIQNIDTDMIIPKEFLKTIKRAGLGFAAFAELRYKNADEVATIGEDVAIPNPDFVLNKPEYADTSILIAGDNFGCGSSREHAPWSINDMGIRCIISTSFADIFYNNCFNNGMLPLILKREEVEELLAHANNANSEHELTIDLPNQKVVKEKSHSWDADGNLITHEARSYSFDIDPFRKMCLLNGLDKIGLTLEKVSEIEKFEEKRSAAWPWLDGASLKVPDEVKMHENAPIWSS